MNDLSQIQLQAEQEASPPINPLTDIGNCRRFAALHGDRLRYVHPWGKWFCWDGTRWQLERQGESMSAAKETAISIIQEAAKETDGVTRSKILDHAKTAQSSSRLEAMIKLARDEQPIPALPDSFDPDPYLLNTASGTINLTTGEIRQHQPGDMITKSTGQEYYNESGIDAPLWEEFLDTIFAGDSEMIAYVQRLVGSALIGKQQEHILPIFIGCGANGKSVFVNAITYALGDYAGAAAPNLLMSTKQESHPAGMADLFGLRFVVMSETGERQQLDEGQVKSLTGGDRIKARRMREDFWEFEPSHTAVMVTNHLPEVRGTDNGIWRRLKAIPFEVTIPAEQQDKKLSEKLQSEAPQILKWMIEGCIAWQREGLQEPSKVIEATKEYRTDSDQVEQWIEEKCLVGGNYSGKASELLESLNEWANASHHPQQNQRWLAKRLVDKKFTKARTRQGVMYHGIGLRFDEV